MSLSLSTSSKTKIILSRSLSQGFWRTSLDKCIDRRSLQMTEKQFLYQTWDVGSGLSLIKGNLIIIVLIGSWRISWTALLEKQSTHPFWRDACIQTWMKTSSCCSAMESWTNVLDIWLRRPSNVTWVIPKSKVYNLITSWTFINQSIILNTSSHCMETKALILKTWWKASSVQNSDGYIAKLVKKLPPEMSSEISSAYQRHLSWLQIEWTWRVIFVIC